MFSQDQIQSHLQKTITLAQVTLEKGNYPIGALIVNQDNEIVSQTSNQCTSSNDITAHAEIIALRQLGLSVDKRTTGEHTLFTSLEPCFGCSFFIARSNITHIYSALKDPHKGGISDLHDQEQFLAFFQHIEVINEPYPNLADQSKSLMRQYFRTTGNSKAAAAYQ